MDSTGMKAKQNAILREIEVVKLERLGVKLQVEKTGLETDKINLQKTQVTQQIATEGLNQEQIKLTTARINTQNTLIGEYSAQQALNTAQANLLLQRQKDQATLHLKAIDVSGLREQINQQLFLNGNVGSPQLGGSE